MPSAKKARKLKAAADPQLAAAAAVTTDLEACSLGPNAPTGRHAPPPGSLPGTERQSLKAARALRVADLKECGISKKGLIAYLTARVTTPDEHEELVLVTMTSWLDMPGCGAKSETSDATGTAGRASSASNTSSDHEHAPCAALLDTHVTPHATWVQVCECVARIAASPARGHDAVREKALEWLYYLAPNCDPYYGAATLLLHDQLQRDMQLLVRACQLECRVEVTEAWLVVFAELVSALPPTAAAPLCRNAQLVNVLLSILDVRGTEVCESAGDTLLLAPCAPCRSCSRIMFNAS